MVNNNNNKNNNSSDKKKEVHTFTPVVVEAIALKEDVIGPENMLFAGAFVHRSARKFYRLGQ